MITQKHDIILRVSYPAPPAPIIYVTLYIRLYDLNDFERHAMLYWQSSSNKLHICINEKKDGDANNGKDSRDALEHACITGWRRRGSMSAGWCCTSSVHRSRCRMCCFSGCYTSDSWHTWLSNLGCWREHRYLKIIQGWWIDHGRWQRSLDLTCFVDLLTKRLRKHPCWQSSQKHKVDVMMHHEGKRDTRNGYLMNQAL